MHSSTSFDLTSPPPPPLYRKATLRDVLYGRAAAKRSEVPDLMGSIPSPKNDFEINFRQNIPMNNQSHGLLNERV